MQYTIQIFEPAEGFAARTDPALQADYWGGTMAYLNALKEAGVFVHESPELVALLMQVDLDARIPPELYVAVAELLAWLYSIEAGSK